MHFAICFSKKDRETNFSLEEFTQRVIKLKSSKRASLASLKNQMAQPFEINIFLILNLIGVFPIVFLWEYRGVVLLLISLLLAINLKLAYFYMKESKYLKSLKSRIDSDWILDNVTEKMKNRIFSHPISQLWQSSTDETLSSIMTGHTSKRIRKASHNQKIQKKA